ncbi:MAG: hypothetical protein HQL87_15415, partial [Magnetococcales bacterium]|nr:hypothetical protein [Magnetococcales bacterium]
MTMLILIDGLEEMAAAPGALPVLERLAATGRTGRLQFGGEPCFDLFGFSAPGRGGPEADLPLGYAVALGLTERDGTGEPDPERTWCCLGFTHLYKKQNDLRFLSPERTGQTSAECWALVEALQPDWAEAGWSLYAPSRTTRGGRAGPVFSRAADALVRTSPLDLLDGCSLRDRSPVGPDAKHLLPLLTVGQLILARHPVNQERQRAGRVPLNTPWVWGVGRGFGV